jgi:hypothetical protein
MRCLKCGRFRAPEAFPDDKYRKTGKHPYCRECKSAEQRERSKKKVVVRLLSPKICHRCSKKEPEVVFDGRNKLLCVECKIVAHEKEKLSRRVKTKQCRVCGEQKELSGYSSSYCRICKDCFRLPQNEKKKLLNKWAKKRRDDKARRDKYKGELVKLLGGKCGHCGTRPSAKWPLACFDFHHLSNPSFRIAKLIPSRRSRKIEIEKELEQCVVLCSNCHRAEHARQHLKRMKRK